MSMLSKQIKELREMSIRQRNNAKFSGKVFFEIENALSEAADTIEAFYAKLQAENMENGSGWIADREPEESGYYLVTYHEWSNGDFLPKFDDTYVKRLHYQKSEQFIGWDFPKCVDKRAEEDMNMEVLAWCKLPEPYRP